jgi:hypothetical protein
MTWELRSVVVGALLPLTVVAGLAWRPARAWGLELGPLEAIPSKVPPYIFRLPIISSRPDLTATAAVTIRQPPDTLAFVKQNSVELRLRTLADDVELEISQGSLALNRLLPRSELQAARRRLGAVPASDPPPTARAKSQEHSVVDAVASTPQVREGTAESPLIDREMEGIRQEIRRMVAEVAPWGGGASAARAREGSSPALWLALGGGCSASVTCLVLVCVMQRRLVSRERRRQQALLRSIQQLQAQLAAEVPRLPPGQSAVPSLVEQHRLAPASLAKPLRLSPTARRVGRVRSSSQAPADLRDAEAAAVRIVPQPLPQVPPGPVEFLKALTQLRHELVRLQARSVAAATPDFHAGHGRPASP